jgi:hypothetical protein
MIKNKLLPENSAQNQAFMTIEFLFRFRIARATSLYGFSEDGLLSLRADLPSQILPIRGAPPRPNAAKERGCAQMHGFAKGRNIDRLPSELDHPAWKDIPSEIHEI